jgi:hypothetical protein
MQQNDHFNKIFWLLAAALGSAFLYTFLITFIEIPKENVRFADTALGFLLGTVVSGVLAYYVGGSPAQLKKPEQPAGTTTADISATITTDIKPTE